MKVTPRTAEELADDSFGAGTYDYEVADAVDKYSKNGNEMIEVTLTVWNKAGRHISVKDWLLDAMPHKLRHAVESMGVMQSYNSGALKAHDLRGKTGRVICRPDDNGYLKVRDYESAPVTTRASRPPVTSRARAPEPAPAGADIDDEIPF